MSALERGSFLWFMMAVTQIWLSLKLMEEVNEAITMLFGTGAAACFILALVVFTQEQRDLLLNPMKNFTKEVHEEQIKNKARVFGLELSFGCNTIIGRIHLSV